MRKVMVFGTFDGVHEGHKAFLKQAKLHGTHLVVSLAPDAVVERLKERTPDNAFSQRKEALEELELVDEVVEGDLREGEYRVVVAQSPSVIAIGYDQDALEEDLRDWISAAARPIKIEKLDSFKPEIYKSSKLRTV